MRIRIDRSRSVVLLFLAACGDDGGRVVEGPGDTDGLPLTFGDTLPGGDTEAGTSSTTDDSAGVLTLLPGTTSGDAASTGDPGGDCQTLQCGDACCAEGEECVASTCMPTCASGVRCGEQLATCCEAGDVCLAGACASPGAACQDSYDCEEGEFCEPTLLDEAAAASGASGTCLPQPDEVSCEIRPAFEDVTVALEWSWEEEQIISIPIVADVDGDRLPEVVVSTTRWDDGSPSHELGALVILDGQTGREQTRVVNTPVDCGADEDCAAFGTYGRATIGVADLDGDEVPDIVYAGQANLRLGSSNRRPSRIHAVNGLGQLLYSSRTPAGDDAWIRVVNGGPTFANLDDDPASEVVFGAAILDNDLTVVWNGENDDASHFGGPVDYVGAFSAVADLNDDGVPDIVSGRDAWTVDWRDTVSGPSVTLVPLWTAADVPDDGFPAIADFDQNGTPEVVLVAGGTVRVLEGATGRLWCGVDPTGALCEDNDIARTPPFVLPSTIAADRGGPPTVADFDGDGRPEFSAAGGNGYAVFDLARAGEDTSIRLPPGGPPVPEGDIYVKWVAATQDITSRTTGSSIFDFQGDGVAEVLYQDECYFRVYNGETGEVILREQNTSSTIHEYPIVVDVDADGNSEILVVANDTDAGLCAAEPDYTPRHGLFVYGDPSDQWVRTRRVWTSHTYHVTNADSRGLTPAVEENNWEVPGLNNYRQNVQGDGVFNAPDLTVDLGVGFGNCLTEQLEIVATVRNVGSLGVPGGLEVTLYEGAEVGGTVIETQVTSERLLPGGSQTLRWLVDAPGGRPRHYTVQVDGTAAVGECLEDNNAASMETFACPVQG